MSFLNNNMDKKNLLELLALLLWEEVAHGLGDYYTNFGKKLYKDILDDLKKQTGCWQNALSDKFDFDTMNMECRYLSDLYFLEKRLELIEKKLTACD